MAFMLTDAWRERYLKHVLAMQEEARKVCTALRPLPCTRAYSFDPCATDTLSAVESTSRPVKSISRLSQCALAEMPGRFPSI